MTPHEHQTSKVINDHVGGNADGGTVTIHDGGDNNLINGHANNNDVNDSQPQQQQRQLHVKDEEWDNLGRSFLHCNNNTNNENGDDSSSSHEESIERNSAMLEDLLLLALQHDAAAAASSSNNNSDDATEEILKELPTQLKTQLRSYVTQISSKYHRVGFHAFEHASHVMLSATKLCYMLKDAASADSSSSATIYDPWLHFALTFAALLHDVDHKGLPNAILKSHSDPLSIRYGSPICMSSYAEWNSVDIGCSLLESNEYDVLRGVLLNKGNGGQQRGGGENFMKMVQDLVLCTDIASSQRRELGMSKWERLFVNNNTTITAATSSSWRNHRRSSVDTLEMSNTKSAKAKNNNNNNGNGGDDGEKDDTDNVQGDDNTTPPNNNNNSILQKKIQLQTPEAARAIAEQIMQAADVSHTMQHFDTFLKWNQSLYHEILAAHYQAQKENNEGVVGGSKEQQQHHHHGNNERHPAQNWYESQIGFFDGYVIPLAKRLDACGAFGMGGGGGGGIGGGGGYFVPLAVRNKELWILRGRECTRTMVSEAEGIELPPPMQLNVAEEGEDDDDGEVEEGENDVGAAGEKKKLHRPMPKSTFLQRRILGNNSLDEESDSSEDDEEDDGNDIVNDKTDVSSIPGSVETSGRVSIMSARSTDSRRSLKWDPKREGRK